MKSSPFGATTIPVGCSKRYDAAALVAWELFVADDDGEIDNKSEPTTTINAVAGRHHLMFASRTGLLFMVALIGSAGVVSRRASSIYARAASNEWSSGR
jgi:hypothetical protein